MATYECFFCDDAVGSISWMRDHFAAAHDGATLKVRGLGKAEPPRGQSM
jgi:hypothetical protein